MAARSEGSCGSRECQGFGCRGRSCAAVRQRERNGRTLQRTWPEGHWRKEHDQGGKGDRTREDLAKGTGAKEHWRKEHDLGGQGRKNTRGLGQRDKDERTWAKRHLGRKKGHSREDPGASGATGPSTPYGGERPSITRSFPSSRVSKGKTDERSQAKQVLQYA